MTNQAGVYHVGGGVTSPRLLYAPNPQFPAGAPRTKGFHALVVVSLIADSQGNPQRIQVVRSFGGGFDQKAIEAVRQYRFSPATLGGKPVPVEVNIEVNFKVY
jgi:periplasmic protein TonB